MPRRLALLALPLVAAAGAAEAAPATNTGNAKVQMNGPIAIIRLADMSFGDVIAGPANGTVIVSPTSDTRTVTGVTAAGGTVQSARFRGVGRPNRVAFLRWSTAPITLTRIGGGATMQMDQLRSNGSTSTTSGNDPRTFGADGLIDIRFGARLRVGANQMEGTYEGSFTVTLDYP